MFSVTKPRQAAQNAQSQTGNVSTHYFQAIHRLVAKDLIFHLLPYYHHRTLLNQ